jgi:thioester reductase-like protein
LQVKGIYLLVRGKKQHAASKRVDTLLCGPLFHLLHKDAAAGKRNVFSKVQVIEGDLTKLNLGLSDEDMLKLQQEVGIILHSGANIELDADVQMTLK